MYGYKNIKTVKLVDFYLVRFYVMSRACSIQTLDVFSRNNVKTVIKVPFREMIYHGHKDI